MPRRPLLVVATMAASAVLLAGCGGGPAPDPVNAADPADADVTLVGNNQLQYENPDVTVAAGDVVIALTSTGAVNHNVVIEGVNGGRAVVEAGGNATAAGRATLEPGTYDFWCSIPGHRAAGMVGVLTVE